MKVGTKELKNRLSEYLRCVRRGEVVYVTDRGRVVAEIRRAAERRPPEADVLDELVAEGLVTRGSGAFDVVQPVAVRRGVLLSRRLLEDRR